jgi:DNA (cytosine-5)-methyltransferase 1
MHLAVRELRNQPVSDFLRGWHALLWLFPGLHPDNALDHGPETRDWPEAQSMLPLLLPEERRFYPRSGWPCSLVLIGGEAWRRFKAHEIDEDDFYCVEAQRARLNSAGFAPLAGSHR